MKKILLFPLLFVTSAFGLTVTSATASNVSHASLFLTYTTDQAINYQRVRIYTGLASCSGSGGVSLRYANLTPLGVGYSFEISGLSASTQYQICPEISLDNSNWVTGAGANITTQPLPAIHPAPPNPPTTFAHSYPDTTGYTQVTVSSGCSDLMSDIDTAIQNQMTNGTVINIPAGMVCSGTGNGTNGNYNIVQQPPDVTDFGASNVDTATGILNIPGFTPTEDGAIIFSANYGGLPGSGGSSTAGPIIRG